MTLFRALRLRPFALLWTGQSLSRLGDFVYEIALAWWVLQKTGSAQTMSLVLIFAITPSVLFSLVGGVAVDRVSRLGLMLASDITRGMAALAVAGLAFAGRLEVWHVFVASCTGTRFAQRQFADQHEFELGPRGRAGRRRGPGGANWAGCCLCSQRRLFCIVFAAARSVA